MTEEEIAFFIFSFLRFMQVKRDRDAIATCGKKDDGFEGWLSWRNRDNLIELNLVKFLGRFKHQSLNVRYFNGD
jgi:hypothetical protein